MLHYIFDVDGTLTPSRSLMDPDFQNWFFNFSNKNSVYLVTGSDRVKTIEQVGEPVYFAAKRVYNCSGNEVWEGDKVVNQNKMNVSTELLTALKEKSVQSKHPTKTGNHIEHRMGLINFSTVGRNANSEQRLEYVKFDLIHKERNRIAEELSQEFAQYQFQVAGDIGMDITEKGKDKGQIVKDFDAKDKLVFFGDTTHEGGNDYPLKKVIEDNDLGITYRVNDWQHTWEILKDESGIHGIVV